MYAADVDKEGEDMEKVWITLILTGNMWLDLKKREISLLLTGMLALSGLWEMIWRNGNLAEHLIPLGIAGILTGVSILSAGGLGMGDVLLLAALGMVLEMSEYLIMLSLALFLSAGWAIFLLIFRKKGRKAEFPMVPFLLMGYLGSLMICG